MYSTQDWQISAISDGSIRISKAGVGQTSSATGLLTTNNWYHIAFTKSGGTTKGYINGVERLSTATNYFTNPALNLRIGGSVYSSDQMFLNGYMDEVRFLKGRALSTDEIAETYRMGANHHLTRQVSSTDLSGANKLPFYVAADRPGAYLEAMLGESDYANYELASSTLALSTNTVLYIKGDEIASSTSIKDSSFSGKAITANGNARTAGGGKIGNSVYFDGTGNYLSLADSDDWVFGTGDFSIEVWVNLTALNYWQQIAGQRADGGNRWVFGIRADTNEIWFYSVSGTIVQADIKISGAISTGEWHHFVVVRNGNGAGSIKIYKDL